MTTTPREQDALAPRVSPARYAKGKVAVHCPSDGSGIKTRAARLASAFNCRWSNREKAYIMSPINAQRVMTAYREGRDAYLDEVSEGGQNVLGFRLEQEEK